jgi:hypothetical protein
LPTEIDIFGVGQCKQDDKSCDSEFTLEFAWGSVDLLSLILRSSLACSYACYLGLGHFVSPVGVMQSVLQGIVDLRVLMHHLVFECVLDF